MDKITTQEIVEKTVYKTLDGEIFDCEKDALAHEKRTVLKEKMNKIKSTYSDEVNLIHDQVYYIENTSDFMTVVKYLNLCHKFTEKDFCGADWYFFYCEDDYNYGDRYWVETLTEKKQKWEENCKQFEE